MSALRLPGDAGVQRWLGPLVFAAVVLGPVFALLPATAGAVSSDGAGLLELALPTGRRAGLLLRSLGLAAGVSATGMALGVLAATVLVDWRRGPLERLRWFVPALALIPAYVHALVCSDALGRAGTWLAPVGRGPAGLGGWTASWAVQSLALLTLATAIALAGLTLVEPRLVEAARLARPDAQVLRRVTLPLAAPILVAGAGLLLLLTLTEYTVPSLFAVNVYALEVFAEYSASGDAARALALAIPLLAVAALAVVGLQKALRAAATAAAPQRPPGGGPPVYPGGLRLARAAALAVLGGHFALVIVLLGAATGSPAQLAEAALAARADAVFSLLTAIGTCVLALPLAVLAAGGMAGGRAAGLWCVLVAVPLAVPAPLIGIGLATAATWGPLHGLQGSAALPALAATARFAPFAAIIMLAGLKRVDRDLLDAARLLPAAALRTWARVLLPLLAPGLIAATVVVGALTASELGATLAVAPPGRATLTMRIYNYLHYGGTDEAAGLCLLMAALGLAAGALALAVVRGRQRPAPGGAPGD